MKPTATESAELVHILDVDPDLGRDLDAVAASEARQRIVARAETVPAGTRYGTWGPPDPRACAALMIVEGLITREFMLGRGRCAELLGPPDLIRPWDHDSAVSLPVSGNIEWNILVPSRVALIDADVIRRAQPWAAVSAMLTARAVWRAQSLAVHQAIDQLSRVDHRLVLLFWHLAQRWGRVTPEGIVLELPLTHELLARLTGARRPSVTTALGQLAQRGLVRRRADRAWLIPHGTEAEVRTVLGAGRGTAAMS